MSTRPSPLAGLAAFASSVPAHVRAAGDPDLDAFLAVIERALEAFATQHEEGARVREEMLLDRGTMSSVAREEGVPVARIRSFAESLERTRRSGGERTDLERMWDPTILVDGDAAMIWTPHDFWLDGEFSHGGVDLATLLRTEEGWKIAVFPWSVVQDFESPLAPPATGAEAAGSADA